MILISFLLLDGLMVTGAPKRPNIVFMMADDHTSQAWGCYGSRFAPHFTTPNIDRIAKEGVLLKNCFVTNSICVPSRASILTGQYSHVNGVKTLSDQLDPRKKHVGHLLQEVGYQTALIGKWHLKTAPAGFDYWNIIKGQGRYHEPILYEMDLDQPEVQKDGYSTDVFTTKALEWLDQRDQDRPFCLMLHFKATHEPWQFHPRHAALFDQVTFPEPVDLLGVTGPKNSRIPGWPLEILTKRMTDKPNHGDGYLELTSEDPVEIRKKTYQKFVKDFLRCAVAIDENIGRVLDYLDASTLRDDTIVIYTSDQGYFMGEHNYFDKRFMLEESLRMPFVMRYPPDVKAGSVVDEIILNVDVAPTLLDFANQTIPADMQGRSIRGVLRGETPENWRKSMYYRYWENSRARPSHYGVRSLAEKLIFYDGLGDEIENNGWEFYDLERDPGEQINIYDEVAQEGRVKRLKEDLLSWRNKLGDL